MPNTVQVLNGKSFGTFSTFPVFDTLIKEGLYAASLTFRTKGVFPYPPGTVVCCFIASQTPFVVEEIVYDSNGVSEVRCISAWEMLKRRHTGPLHTQIVIETFQPIGYLPSFLTTINRDPNRWFVYWMDCDFPMEFASYTAAYDPSKSIYDHIYDAALYNQLYLSSNVIVTPNNSQNITVNLLMKSLNAPQQIFDIGPLNSVTSRLTRRLPPSPTHWFIEQTKDYGVWKMASRGRIRTWYENRAYMQDTTDWKGSYRYEAGLAGSKDREWGQTTEELRCDPLKSVVLDIDEITQDRFGNLTIGRPVSVTTMGVMVTGYIVERTISGGDLTTYSVKIQPDRFYENGEEVTDKWI